MKNTLFDQKNEREERESFFHKLTVLPFGIVLVAGCVLGLVLPLRETVSEAEKRKLAEFPEFTAETFLSGSYTSDISTWYADTFPGRDRLIEAEQKLQNLYGIRGNVISNVGHGDDIPDLPDESDPIPSETDPVESGESQSESESASENESESESERPTEVPTREPEPTENPADLASEGHEIANMNPQEAGDVNIKNLTGYCVYGFNLQAANQFAEAVGSMANALAGTNAKVYEIMVPNNSGVMLDDATKKAWNLSDEAKVIRYYHAKTREFNNSVVTVPIYDALRAHNSEYLYFRTDHHWTMLGAYYGYREFCAAAGLAPNDLSLYHTEETKGFLGSYYYTNGYTQLGPSADTVISYVPLTTNEFSFYDDTLNTMRTGKIIRNMSQFDNKYGYMGFIYGDNSYSIITNPSVKNGRKALVVKESFGNCFVPFLADHFEEVVIVDYRYYKSSIPALAREHGSTDVVFVNNLEALSDIQTTKVLLDKCR